MLRDRPPLAAAAILGVLLVPATWYLGAWWGQLDAVYVALCLWAAILASRDRRWLFAVVLGLAMMTKPQALFLAAPFAGYAIGRWGVRRAALVGLVAAAVAALTWLPFLPYDGVADYLRNLDYYQNGEYPILSVRAWNPWWLLQAARRRRRVRRSIRRPCSGPLTPRHLGIAMTALAEVVVFVALLRRATPERLYLGLAAATLAAFCLMTSMHERYAFAALVFLAPLLARRPVQVAWGILAVAISLNVVAGAPPDQIGPIIPLGGLVGDGRERRDDRRHGDRVRAAGRGPSARGGQRGAGRARLSRPRKASQVPAQVVGQPLPEPEAALAAGAVAPGRGDLGQPAALEGRLHGELDRQLEAGLALDGRRVEEAARCRA